MRAVVLEKIRPSAGALVLARRPPPAAVPVPVLRCSAIGHMLQSRKGWAQFRMGAGEGLGRLEFLREASRSPGSVCLR